MTKTRKNLEKELRSVRNKLGESIPKEVEKEIVLLVGEITRMLEVKV
jgi:hypothetical protein